MKERHDVPVVTVMIWYRVGSAHERLGEKGLAHYLEHMLFKGTDRYARGEIDLITMKNGGSNNAFTAEDYTAYFFSFASDRWQEALEIEANRMGECLFEEKEVEAERKVVIEELKLFKDSPWDALYDEVQALSFSVHPYRHPIIGYQEQLENVPRQRIFDFYRQHYNPSNATLVIVGDFNSEETVARVQELFGGLKAGAATEPVEVTEPVQAGEKRITVLGGGEVPRLLALYGGAPFDSRDAVILDVAGHVLSSGKSSRLYRRFVEVEKLATSVETHNDARKQPGLFQVQIELQNVDDTARAEAVLDEELEALSREDVTGDELQRARNIATSEFIFDQETSSGLATKIGYFDTLASYRFLEEYLPTVRSITPKDLRNVATRYFDRSQRSLGLSLPEKPGDQSASTDETRGPSVPRRAYRNRPDSPGRSAGEAQAAGAGSAVRGDMLVDVQREIMDNGLTVLFLESRSLPVVAINCYVRAGRRFEPAGKEGLAQFVGRMLDEGTATRTADEIAVAIEAVGGKLVTDSLGARATVLSRDLDLGLQLTADCLINPTFDPGRLEMERSRIQSEIRADADDPSRVAYDAFREIVYAGHPLHAPMKGYSESIAALKQEDLKSFHQRYHRPGNAVLAIVGDFETAELLPQLRRYFGGWKAAKAGFPQLPALTRSPEAETRRVKMDKEQINVYLGHLGVRRANPDYHALLVMDYILGTGPGFTDRISKSLRDDQGLAYTVYANISESSTEEPGVFSAYIGTSPENREKAIGGMLQEIRKFRDEGCTEEELANAKAYLTGNFVFNFETTSQVADMLIELERFELGFDYIARYPLMLEAVTVNDVNRVARKYLDPEAMKIVIVGPEDKKEAE